MEPARLMLPGTFPLPGNEPTGLVTSVSEVPASSALGLPVSLPSVPLPPSPPSNVPASIECKTSVHIGCNGGNEALFNLLLAARGAVSPAQETCGQHWNLYNNYLQKELKIFMLSLQHFRDLLYSSATLQSGKQKPRIFLCQISRLPNLIFSFLFKLNVLNRENKVVCDCVYKFW
jgi:hypothetical protein